MCGFGLAHTRIMINYYLNLAIKSLLNLPLLMKYFSGKDERGSGVMF